MPAASTPASARGWPDLAPPPPVLPDLSLVGISLLLCLALAVAAQLNLSRRDDESMEAFFQRIASALDDMTPDEQAAVEIRAGLKILRIEIPALAAALKQPDSALAARLAAAAETPLATPLKTTAAMVTTNYLQEAPGVSRAAETLAMVAQAHSNTEGGGIFSSAPAAICSMERRSSSAAAEACASPLASSSVAAATRSDTLSFPNAFLDTRLRGACGGWSAPGRSCGNKDRQAHHRGPIQGLNFGKDRFHFGCAARHALLRLFADRRPAPAGASYNDPCPYCSKQGISPYEMGRRTGVIVRYVIVGVVAIGILGWIARQVF